MYKEGQFKQVRFIMERANGYGQYYIKANYRGKKLKVYTNDSEAWDWLDDDSNREKQLAARRSCYYKIRTAYNAL